MIRDIKRSDKLFRITNNNLHVFMTAELEEAMNYAKARPERQICIGVILNSRWCTIYDSKNPDYTYYCIGVKKTPDGKNSYFYNGPLSYNRLKWALRRYKKDYDQLIAAVGEIKGNDFDLREINI